MKILMIAPCPYILTDIKGGVEAVTVNLLQGFKEIDDIEMLIVSIRREIQKEEIVAYSNNIQIQYIPFGKIKSTKLEMLFHGRKKVKQIVEDYKPDIIHVQGNGSILMLLTGLDKSNVLITQHAILKEELKHQNTTYGKISHLINVITEKIFARNIQNKIFISNYNLALNSLTTLKNYELIYNPVNYSFFQLDSNDTNSYNILYIGEISKRKGLADLVSVISSLNKKGIHYHLDVVGGVVDQTYKEDIDALVSKNSLQEKIKFHGWQTQNEILEIMNEISILVLPSYQETLPVTIAEAMAAGKIVIATNVGGISEMIEDKVSGFLFEKGNKKQLESLLRMIQDKKQIRKRISLIAKDKAEKMFTPISVAQHTVNFYKKI